MNKEFTFNALKGNAKIVDLDTLIETKKQQLALWVEPYWRECRKNWTVWNDNFFWQMEPDWPAGKKRTLSKRYQQDRKSIIELANIKEKLLNAAFPNWQDDHYDYSIEPIVVNRKKIEDEE
jgi:hypothetical protein